MRRMPLTAVARHRLAWTIPLILFGGALSAQGAPSLPADTVLIVRLTSGVSTATAKVGELVEATLIEPRRGGGLLAPGTRVAGRVESVRKAERGRAAAALDLRFTDAGGGQTPAARMDARVLVVKGRRYEVNDGVIGVRDIPRGPGEESLLGPPLGAGVGLLVGRSGAAAAIGALAGFAVWYLPSRLHTTNDHYAEIDLQAGQELSLHTR